MTKAEVCLLDLPPCEVGEGIVWCDRRQMLWWVDIGASRVHSHAPATGATAHWDMPDKPGCLALTEGDEVVVALADGLHLLDPASSDLRLLTSFPDMPLGHRPNDGAVSRSGRFYVGTVALVDRSKPDGVLYVFDPHRGVRRLFGGIHVSNGLVFSPDDRTAYLSDSWPEIRKIWAYDHNPATGNLTRKRPYFDTAITAGRPDGACIDADGFYWMAGVGGGEILRLSPCGDVDLRIEVPVMRPSKPCFGGPDLGTLYITSIGASDGTRDDGRLITIDVPFRGLREGRLNLAKRGI
ncbi:MAG: SMP-30/gluconolactonase/LRE family protein [Litorimonas sp.]